MEDSKIIDGLVNNYTQRPYFEKQLYLKYQYFIKEGTRKYHLNYEDSFSAYSDALLAAILNIANRRFDNKVLLKTYLFTIFSHKCVDLVRKATNNKESVNQNDLTAELLNYLPDTTRVVVEKLIEKENVDNLKKSFDKVGDKCKEILLLHEDGYTDNMIAEKMAYNSAAVVKTTRMRCREKIKELYSVSYE